ncbi:hypothetical protein Tco_0985838 [Tanacetum coccineum]
MECQVESLMRSEVLLDYEVGFTFPERPYQEEFEGRMLNFEENKLEYEDENEVEIKMMGTGIDKESLEHNLYENDITSIICHKFSLTSNPPIKPKDSDPKQHYGFKPGLLGQSGSLGVDFSNLEVIENNFLKGLSLPMEKN